MDLKVPSKVNEYGASDHSIVHSCKGFISELCSRSDFLCLKSETDMLIGEQVVITQIGIQLSMYSLLQNFTHCGQDRCWSVIGWVLLITLLEKSGHLCQFPDRWNNSRLNGEVGQRLQNCGDYINKAQQFFC